LNNTAKILIISGVVVLFVFLLYYFGLRKTDNSYITDDWTETYAPNDKGPYGTYMLKELLDTAGLFGNFLELDTKLEDVLEDEEGVNDIYFFVGAENFLEAGSIDHLYNFVLAGNTIFMSCENFPIAFLEPITLDALSAVELEPNFDSIQHFKFTHPELVSKRYSSTYIYNNKVTMKYWNYLNENQFDLYADDTMYVLGTNTKDQPNFLKIKYGNGSIYLHSTPYLFTNVSLMRREGFQYAEKVLEHIPPGRIQWDRYNLQNHYSENNEEENEGDGTGGDENRQSILQFILKHPPLVWAILILLAGAILYALFKGKRMQKIIPAAELKENTSLGYINTLASLYLQENKHQKLIHLKEKTFLNFIAEHYYISCKTPDEKFIEKVAVKSQVEKEKITEIFNAFYQLQRVQIVTDEELILLHKKIEYFYKKCR